MAFSPAFLVELVCTASASPGVGFPNETKQLVHVKPRRAFSFHRRFFSEREYKFLTTSAFVSRLWRFGSVRVGTPRPSSPVTRWVAFHWVLWTLQLDKHSTAHSACLAAVWTERPRQDPLLHFICHPIAAPATLSLLGRKIKKTGMKTWPLVRVHSVWIDINHSFMEVPDGVDETCVLQVLLLLTRITDEPLEVVMTVELGRQGQYSLRQWRKPDNTGRYVPKLKVVDRSQTYRKSVGIIKWELKLEVLH